MGESLFDLSEQTMNLKVGDIVKYKDNSRICNGRYGYIVEYENMLILHDNENAPEIFGITEEDKKLLDVVGNIKTNPELLNIWWDSKIT